MTRLLALRLSALGDVIHTIPAVVGLREAGYQVSWVVEAPYRELVEMVARVNAIPVQMKTWARSPRRATQALRAIRGHDIAVDFQGLLKSVGFAWLSRAPLRYGFDRDAIREKPAAFFTNRRVRIDRTRHVVEWNLQLAEAVAGKPLHPRPDFAPFPTGDHLAKYAGRIVLLPGAGRPEKQWPVESFRALAKNYRSRALVVWGPGEQKLAEEIGGDVAPKTNLRELAFLLQKAAVVIGGDTGPLHLAAALGTRVIGLYGPTDPRRNGPYGQLDSCISEFGRSESMAAIQLADVMKRIEEATR